MKRSGPLRRNTPLKRTGPISRAAPLPGASQPKRAKKSKRDESLADARRAVFARSVGRCEANWPGCTTGAEHAHHRLRRSQGGKHTPENLLAVCSHCHEQIHRNPARAYELGHMTRSSD